MGKNDIYSRGAGTKPYQDEMNVKLDIPSLFFT